MNYTITNEYDGYTLNSFLTNHYYASSILTTLRKDCSQSLINGIPSFLNSRLKVNDEVTITIKEITASTSVLPISLDFEIVYEDEDLIVINKPAAMPIHPSINNYQNTLANALAYYYQNENSPFIFRCINRLDRDTSGLTIVAKNVLSASILNQMMANREIKKTYLAITTGLIEPAQGTISAPIARKEESCIERCIDYDNGEEAITHYKLINTISQNGNIYSEIELNLDTGRTHQIRVHMAHIGHPLIGDFLYNPEDHHMNRQALHANSISFRHPITFDTIELYATIPEDFKNFLS